MSRSSKGPPKPKEPKLALTVTRKPKARAKLSPELLGVMGDFQAPSMDEDFAEPIVNVKSKKPHLTLQVDDQLLVRLDAYVKRVRRNPEQAGASRGSIVRAAIEEYLRHRRM